MSIFYSERGLMSKPRDYRQLEQDQQKIKTSVCGPCQVPEPDRSRSVYC